MLTIEGTQLKFRQIIIIAPHPIHKLTRKRQDEIDETVFLQILIYCCRSQLHLRWLEKDEMKIWPDLDISILTWEKYTLNLTAQKKDYSIQIWNVIVYLSQSIFLLLGNFHGRQLVLQIIQTEQK